MDKKQYSEGGYQMVGGANKWQRRRTSIPPKRGRIKNEIFASVVRTVVSAAIHSIKAFARTGRTLTKLSNGIVASFSVCYGRKGNLVPYLLRDERL